MAGSSATSDIEIRKSCMKKLTSKSSLVTAAWAGTLTVAMLTMAGCATKPTYQNNQSGPTIITNNQGVPNYYLVKRGDTVGQIAERYRLSYRQVGALNGLDSNYTIYTGQMLKLWQGNQAAASNNNADNNNNKNNNNNNKMVIVKKIPKKKKF